MTQPMPYTEEHPRPELKSWEIRGPTGCKNASCTIRTRDSIVSAPTSPTDAPAEERLGRNPPGLGLRGLTRNGSTGPNRWNDGVQAAQVIVDDSNGPSRAAASPSNDWNGSCRAGPSSSNDWNGSAPAARGHSNDWNACSRATPKPANDWHDASPAAGTTSYD